MINSKANMSLKELKREIEELIIREFKDSKHAVVEHEDMIAIVKTDYKAMAEAVAEQLLDLITSRDEQIEREERERTISECVETIKNTYKYLDELSAKEENE